MIESTEDWCEYCSYPRSIHRWQELLPEHSFVSGKRADAHRALMKAETQELREGSQKEDK